MPGRQQSVFEMSLNRCLKSQGRVRSRVLWFYFDCTDQQWLSPLLVFFCGTSRIDLFLTSDFKCRTSRQAILDYTTTKHINRLLSLMVTLDRRNPDQKDCIVAVISEMILHSFAMLFPMGIHTGSTTWSSMPLSFIFALVFILHTLFACVKQTVMWL